MKLGVLTASLIIASVPAAWAADAPNTNPYLSNQPAQTSAYPATTFNWFNPYAWMALMTPQPVAVPGPKAAPASTAYPMATFNWFDPNAWATFFNPATWAAMSQPVATSGK